MRTSKKILSFFLAVVMIVTTCSVGFTAFAQDNKNSIWDNDTSAQDAFDALNGLASDYLPGLLMGISIIGNPICDKYAKENPEEATKLYAQYAEENDKDVADLTIDDKRAAVKGAASEEATLSETLAALQPFLIPLLNKAADSIAGGKVFGNSQWDFVQKYYKSSDVSKFDYLKTDGDLDYFSLVMLCDTYKDSPLLTQDEKDTLAEWFDALFPLSKAATSLDNLINKFVNKFNNENPWEDTTINSVDIDLIELFDFEATDEEMAVIEGLYDGYNNQLRDYGIPESDIKIDSLAKVLYYYYGLGKNVITAFRYHDLIAATGKKVTFSGEADIGLGPVEINITEDITPANLREVFTNQVIIKSIGASSLEEAFALAMGHSYPSETATPDEIAYIYGVIGPLAISFYTDTILPMYSDDAIIGIPITMGKVNSVEEIRELVKQTLPNKSYGVDASIFTDEEIKSLGLIVNASYMAGKEAAYADPYFAGEDTTIEHINLNYTIKMPDVLKGTSTAEYFDLITGHSKNNTYKQGLYAAFLTSAANCFETINSAGELAEGPDGLPIILESCQPDPAAISGYLTDAETYAFSKVITDLTGVQGSIKDPKSGQAFIIDVNKYLEDTETDATSVSLTDEQRALIANTGDFTGHIGTVILNDILNKVVLGVLQLELLGQTVEEMINNLLTTKCDLTVALTDVWERLIDSPVGTIVELLPIIIVAADELLLPFLLHGEEDEPPGELYGVLKGSLIMPYTADAGSNIGITTLSWDLNELLPDLMHWLADGHDAVGIEYWNLGTVELRKVEKDEDGVPVFVDDRLSATEIEGSDIKYYTAQDQNGNPLTRWDDDEGVAHYSYMGVESTDLATVLNGHEDSIFTRYMTYESDVPYITGIYVADKAIRGAKLSSLDRILGKKLDDTKLGRILSEVITEFATLFTEAIDEFEATPALADATKYDTKGHVLGKGLNNVFVAIPQLFDLMENLAAEKYGVAENAWTYCFDGKITTKEIEYDYAGETRIAYTTVNTDLEQLKSFAGSSDPNRSVDIFDCFAGIFVEDWINAILSLLNNVVSTDNEISSRLPIISGLLNALGGFGEDSIVTDVINGVFQIEREDDISFTFEKRANGFNGLSQKHAYFLIANIDTLIDVITGLVKNIKNGASVDGNSLISNTKKASSTAPTIKNAKANSNQYSKSQLNNADEFIGNIDTLLSSLLSDSTLNDFSLDSTTNILASVFTFFTNYLGNDCYSELGRLINAYTFRVTGKETHTANENNDVDPEKVYTNDSMTAIMVETFLLIEKIVENLFADFSTTHILDNGNKAQYNLIVEAIEGLISPDAICVRLDGYEKVAKELTKFNCWHNAAAKTSRGDYKISLDWGIKDGDKTAYFKALSASLRLITSILGVVLIDTGWYSTVVMPVLNAVCKPNGIKVDTAAQFAKLTNGYHDEALLGLITPLGKWIDALLAKPATTLVKSIQGIAGILDDKSSPSIASIVKGAITPINNELSGLGEIFGLSTSRLLETSPSLKELLDDIAGKLNKYSTASNITIRNYPLCGKNIIPIVNKLLSSTGISLKQISWSKLANAKTPGAAILYVLDYLLETILDNDNLTALASLINNDIVTMIIEAVKSGKITSTDLLTLVNKVFEATDSPTLVYWTFAQYLQELTENFAYPIGITKKMADNGVNQLDEAVGSVLQLLGSLGVDLGGDDLQAIISKNLFKNELLTKIATALYGALDGLDPTIKNVLKELGIVTSTKDVAKLLKDKSYGKTYTAAANKIAAQKSWSKVSNINWGFKDGSAKAQQGFVNALAAILRPVSDVLSIFLNEGTLQLSDVLYNLIASINVGKTTTYLTLSDGDVPIKVKVTYSMKNGVFNAYFREDNNNRERSRSSHLQLDLRSLKNTLNQVKIEGTNGYNSAIIPLLEVLGCENIKTYKQYQSDAAKAKDNLLLDVLNPLVGDNSGSFLNKLCAHPVLELTNLLPNLAMYLDAHGVSQLISNLLAPVTEILYSAADTLKLDKLLTDTLGMPLGDLIGGLIGIDEGTLNVKLSDLTTLNIEDIIIPIVNKVLSGLDNQYLSKLQLDDIDWNALISLGTKGTYQSKATGADGKFLTGKIVKNVDQGKVLIAVLRYVATILVDNASMLKNLICSIDAVGKNDLIKSIVQSVFNTIATATPDQIVAAVFYILAGEPSNAFWNYTAYQTGSFSFSYPEGIDIDFLKNLPPMLDGLIGSLANLNELIGNLIYKDELISKLATGLYGAIEGVKVGNGTLTDLLAQTDIDFSTSNVANLLVDSRYGQTYAGPASVIRSAGSWKNVSADSLSWGVTDRDSFMHALVAVLRPIYGVLDVLLNSASLGIFNIVRIPGSNGYSAAIVPLLEAFSCYNIKTQYQYRQDMAKEYDAILLDIINPIWDKVEDILAAPLQTIAAMIPNLGLFIGNDGLCQIIDNLLNPVSALLDAVRPVVDLNDLLNTILPALNVDLSSLLGKIGISNFNLDLYDLNKTLKPILGGDAIIPLVNNILGLIKIKGTPLGIQLNPVNWLQLASHGTTIVSYSQAATYGARIFVQGDSSETLIAVLRYLIITINTGNNFNSISSLIGGLIGGADDSITNVVNQVLGKLQGDTDQVIASLVELLQVLGS